MTQTDTELITASRSLGEQVEDRSAEIEGLRRLPDDIAGALVKTGIFRACVPARYGGGELHLSDTLAALEELSYHDGSLGWCAMIGATTSVLAAYLPERWAREIYADDAAVITGGVAAPQGTATFGKDGLVCTGTWQWGSGTQHCKWIGGGCRLVDANGKPTRTDGGLVAPFVFFAAEQVEILDTWHVAGLRGTGSNDFRVVEASVPDGRWVQIATARPQCDGALYRVPFYGLLALGVTSVSLGLARRAFDELVELAGSKRPAQSAKLLAERPVIQAEVARAEAAIRSARALLDRTLEEVWAAATAGELTGEHKRLLRLAATNATLQSAQAVDLMYHAAGGTAVYETSPLQRVFRDMHVATQHAMVAPRTYEVLGRMALGLETDTTSL